MRPPLRLMPLGGSITYGQGSPTRNGYRDPLRRRLLASGEVHLVGSRRSGSMPNSENEGWRGFRTEQILRKAKKSVPSLLPNVFTLNAGANDCVQDFDVEGVKSRMDELLEYLWAASRGSTIIFSTLLLNADVEIEARVRRVNELIRLLAEEKMSQEKRIVLVDMHSQDGPQLGQLPDGTHPNEEGYEKMARIWCRGIEEATARGLIQEAVAM